MGDRIAADLGARCRSDGRRLYVVKSVIGGGELVVIYGAPKSGKTIFGTNMGLS